MKRVIASSFALVAVVIVLTRAHDSTTASSPSDHGWVPLGAPATARSQPSLQSPRLAELPADEVARTDVIVRAMQEPTAATVELLRDVIANDPSTIVRERAIIAYTEVLGKEAAPLLRALATSGDDDTIVAAAAASLHRVRNEFPAPVRAHVEVEMPGRFVPDAAFDVVIRCVADDYVPTAYFALKLPPEVEVLSGDVTPWRGALAEGQVLERRLRVRIPAAAEIRARFTADFPDVFDAETVRLRITADGGTLDSSTQFTRT